MQNSDQTMKNISNSKFKKPEFNYSVSFSQLWSLEPSRASDSRILPESWISDHHHHQYYSQSQAQHNPVLFSQSVRFRSTSSTSTPPLQGVHRIYRTTRGGVGQAMHDASRTRFRISNFDESD